MKTQPRDDRLSGQDVAPHGYQGMVMRKPLELPAAVARAFVKDMRAYFDEHNRYNREQGNRRFAG
jgi:hypothetical protein